MAKFYGGGRSVSGRPDTLATVELDATAPDAAEGLSGRPDTSKDADVELDVAPPDAGSSGRQDNGGDAADEVRLLACASIAPDPDQPRTYFDPGALEELAESISAHGVLQPVLVRPAGDGYMLIAGERRWRACRQLGLATIPAIVRDVAPERAFELALAENVQRDSLLPVEEARAYERMIAQHALSQSELARRVGIDRRRVSEKLSLLQLPEAVRDMIGGKPGQLPEGHALLLARAPDTVDVARLAKQCARDGWSVRQLRAALKRRRDDNGRTPTLFQNIRMMFNRRGGFTLTVRARSRDEVETTIAALERQLVELRAQLLET